MNTNNAALAIAKHLAAKRIAITGIEIRTPDGREWRIVPIAAGHGRFADGHWGKQAGAPGGFRLFEIDPQTDAPQEHDAVNYDTWDMDELMDYLEHVGQPKPGRTNPKTST